jgi:ABC-type Fe3+-hydroxamate transport system substrate-binding protein
VGSKARVGREKDPDLGRIRALDPDLVIANIEENRREVVEQLRADGRAVWVIFPRTVRDGIGVIRELGELTDTEVEAARLADRLEAALAATRQRIGRHRPTRVFCPIWRDPYMSIGRDTYVHDLLAACGGDNVCADLGERYPRVALDELARLRPEVILLPDEPFRFRRVHLADFAALREVPALRDGRVHLVDGKLLSWYGRRIGEALAQLPPLLGSDFET